MPEPVKTVIGFDFGTHCIGVAVGQTLTRQASPLDALRAGDWGSIERLLSDWQPQRLIVGLPLNMQGGDQEMTAGAKRFSRQLEGRFCIESALVDERLTTREAYQVAIASGRKRTKLEIDSLSAVLITESWLRGYDQNEDAANN